MDFWLFSGLTLLVVIFGSVHSPTYLSIYLILVILNFSFILYSAGNSWLAFTMTLMFLGGMMVVFLYLASLSPEVKMVNLSFSLPIVLLSTLMLCWKSDLSDSELGFKSFGDSYSFLSLKFLVFLGLLLYLALLLAVKASSEGKGPLKHF